MAVARQAVALLLAALFTSRGLFAQDSVPPAPTAPATDTAVVADTQVAAPTVLADQAQVTLRPIELRYVQQETLLVPQTSSIKALYVNAWAFASPKLWQLVRLVDATEVNALVVDVKDDTGCLLYPSAVPTAQQTGASACAHAKDAKARLDTLAAHGIYSIARIVVAKDPLLAVHRPAWSVRDRSTGTLWRDRINIAWVDAYNDSVWIYAAQLAQEAVRMGFNEVQFDYVRFPDEPRERMATAIFPAHRAGETQREAVRDHITLLRNRLRPLGVPVTFDIFGLTASATGDLGIGQVWEDFINVADVVLPMVYPSHYYRGAFGLAWPNGQPYRVVRSALSDALQRSHPHAAAAEIRPFLQAFTLGRRRPRYSPFEIREQIRAAEDLGIKSWVLWNPRSVYQPQSLRPKHGATVPTLAPHAAAGELSSASGGDPR
jgi:hypothetical protein